MTVITNAAFEANPNNPQEHSGAIVPQTPLNLPRPGVERQSVVGAALSRENIIKSSHDSADFRHNLNEAQSFAPTDEPFDVGASIPARHIGHADIYAMEAIDQNSADVITARLDQQVDDEQVLQDAGIGGVAARMLSSVADPTTLPVIPINLIRNMRTVGKVAMGAGVLGGSVAAQEVFLQNTQDNRTIEETNIAITTGTIFGAVLGPLLSRNDDLFKEAINEMRAAARGQDKTFVVDGQKVKINRDSFRAKFSTLDCP
jgi:hypothetical protein